MRRDVSAARDKSLLLQTLNLADLPEEAEGGDPALAAKTRKPVADDTVSVTYELRQVLAGQPDRVLEPQRKLQFVIGEEGVPPAVEQAISQMQLGEVAVVDVVRGVAATALQPPAPNEHAFFAALPAEWLEGERAVAAERAALDAAEVHVPRRPNWVRAHADEVVARMRITLHAITPATFGWELSPEAQLAEANAAKARGAALFAQNRFEQAKKKFKRAVALVEQRRNAAAKHGSDDEDDDGGADSSLRKVNEVALSCHLNIAACQLKLKEYTAVLESTNHALKIDADNVKAMFRRAQALIQLSRWDEADELLAAAVRLEPNNTAVRDEIHQQKVRRQQHAVKERSQFSSVFDKLADQEAKERKQRLQQQQHGK